MWYIWDCLTLSAWPKHFWKLLETMLIQMSRLIRIYTLLFYPGFSKVAFLATMDVSQSREGRSLFQKHRIERVNPYQCNSECVRIYRNFQDAKFLLNMYNCWEEFFVGFMKGTNLKVVNERKRAVGILLNGVYIYIGSLLFIYSSTVHTFFKRFWYAKYLILNCIFVFCLILFI